MQNAVWLYFREGFNPPATLGEFLSWTDSHAVKLVLLHFDGKLYAEKVFIDPAIEEFIQGCHEHGLVVHGLFNALTSIPETWFNEEHRQLFCVDYHGISILDEPISGQRYFLDPNQPQVVQMLKRMSYNILQSYPILKGIQLDFLRYYHWESKITIDAKEMGHNVSFLKEDKPLKLAVGNREVSYFLIDSTALYNDPPFGGQFNFEHNFSYCFCDYCLKTFEEKYQVQLPPDKSVQPAWILEHEAEKWHDYRAEILAAALKEIRASIKECGADKECSITLWYNSPYGNELLAIPANLSSVVAGFGQKWWEWVKRGLVDFVCPMNYWLEPRSFAEVITTQIKQMAGVIPLYAGLLQDAEYPITAEKLMEYKGNAKSAGATGICYFHYGTWQNK